jgi:bacteriorhodopsin
VTVTPAEAEPSPPRSRRLLVRLALALVAVAFLSLMNRSLTAAVVEYSETAQIPPLMVTAYVAFAALAGAAFGLGAMLPNRISTVHWRRALTLAALPAILLALNLLAFTSPGSLPGWLTNLDFLFGLQGATAGAILVGIAAASAVAET